MDSDTSAPVAILSVRRLRAMPATHRFASTSHKGIPRPAAVANSVLAQNGRSYDAPHCWRSTALYTIIHFRVVS